MAEINTLLSYANMYIKQVMLDVTMSYYYLEKCKMAQNINSLFAVNLASANLELVDKFRYLDDMLSVDGDADAAVQVRI